MAQPERRVVNIVGDGSLLYYPHALWTAARANAPIPVVVLDHGCYRVLKLIIDRMGGPWGANAAMTPGLDVQGPAVDFVALAGSIGVPAERATRPDELRTALDRGLVATGPYHVDVVIEQD